MDTRDVKLWARRGILITVGVLATALLIATWLFSSAIRTDVLLPQPFDPEPDIDVFAASSGLITLSVTDLSVSEGVYGLVGANGYGQISSVLSVTQDRVERSYRELEGTITAGERVRIDQYAFVGDPLQAHGISFDEVLIAGDNGFYPAWFVDGDEDTWVIIVHGKGLDERKQALRIIPMLHDEEYPVLTISYRNDVNAPMSRNGLYGWGLSEWRDVEAALKFARTEGAERFVLYGYSMGGAVTSMFLHESLLIDDVAGVIWDSPVLDLGAVVEAGASDRGIPGYLTTAAMAVAAIRSGIDWDALDQIERAAEFDEPILLMHGGRDATVPVRSSDVFAELRSDIVTYVRFDDADHVLLWNGDPVRYENAVRSFLDRVSAPPPVAEESAVEEEGAGG